MNYRRILEAFLYLIVGSIVYALLLALLTLGFFEVILYSYVIVIPAIGYIVGRISGDKYKVNSICFGLGGWPLSTLTMAEGPRIEGIVFSILIAVFLTFVGALLSRLRISRGSTL